MQLKEEETEEQLFLQHMAIEDLEDLEDVEDLEQMDEGVRANRSAEMKSAATDALKRKYANIAKAVMDDPM